LKNLQRFHEILGDVLKSFNELRGPSATDDQTANNAENVEKAAA
jgi:hypothetical protein